VTVWQKFFSAVSQFLSDFRFSLWEAIELPTLAGKSSEAGPLSISGQLAEGCELKCLRLKKSEWGMIDFCSRFAHE
jgi:hypothetical protein